MPSHDPVREGLKSTHERVPEPRACVECGTAYVPRRGHQRFCGDRCRLLSFYRRRVAALQAERD
jgi:predicted nucleic acid-binding Zn ribbon protein